MNRRPFPLVLIALLVSLVILSSTALAQTPKRGGTLRVSYGNEIAHLDFHTAPGYEMMWVAMNVGCGLVNITPDGKFVGDAADSWQVSSDNLTYTFKLKKQRPLPRRHPGGRGRGEVQHRPADGSGDQVRDARLLRLRALASRCSIPGPCRCGSSSPTPSSCTCWPPTGPAWSSTRPTATQKYSLEDRKQGKPGAVVGCGPFRLVEWVKGSHLVMERFDKYFVPGLPYLDRVVIRTIKDPVTEMAAFKAGEIDFIASFSPEHVDTLKAQNPSAVIMTGKETTPMLAAMKVTVPKDGKPMSKERAPHPIFGDLRVRKAIGCYGIDRQEIVKIAFKGKATPWVGHEPAGHARHGGRQPPVPLRPGQGQGHARGGGLRPGRSR